MLVFLPTFFLDWDHLHRRAMAIRLVEIASVALYLVLLVSLRDCCLEGERHELHVIRGILVRDIESVAVLLGDVRPLALFTCRKHPVVVGQVVALSNKMELKFIWGVEAHVTDGVDYHLLLV